MNSCAALQVIHRDLKPAGHSREHFAPAPENNFPWNLLLEENVLIVRKDPRRHLKHVIEKGCFAGLQNSGSFCGPEPLRSEMFPAELQLNSDTHLQ